MSDRTVPVLHETSQLEWEQIQQKSAKKSEPVTTEQVTVTIYRKGWFLSTMLIVNERLLAYKSSDVNVDDFGYSRSFDKHKAAVNDNVTGSVHYEAPVWTQQTCSHSYR